MINLIINAMHALQAKGDTLRIQTRPARQPGVCISVRDNGPGIPQRNMRQVFEPFYTTKDGKKGSGLGLYIVSSIVAQNGGEIDLKSEPGKFTEFVVFLPENKTGTET